MIGQYISLTLGIMKVFLKIQNGCWNDWNAISVKINYPLKIKGVIKSLDTGIFACLQEEV